MHVVGATDVRAEERESEDINRSPTRSQEDPMNTSPTTTVARGRFHRLLVGVLLALGLSVGSVATMAAPANAASYVEGCFRSNKAGMGVASLPVQLQAYWQGSWYTIASSTLPNSGCVAWNVGTANRGYYLRLLVNYRAHGAYWYGSSPYYANPGQGRANVQTGVITCYGCAF